LIHHFNIHYILLLNAPISVEQINKKHLNRVAIALCHPGKASAQSRDTFPKKKNLNRVALCHLGKGSAKVIRHFVVCW
jgi:hypothetical protein